MKNVTATPWSRGSSSPVCWPTVPVSDEPRKKESDTLHHTNSKINNAFLASISTSDCDISAFSDSLRHLKFSWVSDMFPRLLPWSSQPAPAATNCSPMPLGNHCYQDTWKGDRTIPLLDHKWSFCHRKGLSQSLLLVATDSLGLDKPKL